MSSVCKSLRVNPVRVKSTSKIPSELSPPVEVDELEVTVAIA